MTDKNDSYEVEETELSEFETGFITGVLEAWGVKGQPTENQFRDALALMMSAAKNLDSQPATGAGQDSQTSNVE